MHGTTRIRPVPQCELDRGIFRSFAKQLKKHWKMELPSVRPLEKSCLPYMPKASSFHAGYVNDLKLHVFINFHHSCRAFQVGQFTINIILSLKKGCPKTVSGPFVPKDGHLKEGCYRIGSLLDQGDKWWRLRDNNPPITRNTWKPTTYEDDAVVNAEAVEDVTRDIRSVLARLGVAACRTA